MRQQANYHYLFVSITIIFCCSLSMILIFSPKVVEYMRRRKKRRHPEGGGSTAAGSGGGGAGSGKGGMRGHGSASFSHIQDERSSRDDEEQYNKLQKENRDLAQKIREKDSQMKAMIARIEEAREKANESLGIGLAPRRPEDTIGAPGNSLRGRKCIMQPPI